MTNIEFLQSMAGLGPTIDHEDECPHCRYRRICLNLADEMLRNEDVIGDDVILRFTDESFRRLWAVNEERAQKGLKDEAY